MTRRDAESAAMSRALDLAQSPGVPLGPNPRVGCVLLAPDGTTVAEGLHRGAGTPHAEIDALSAAGDRAHGATAVVTLEPCNHTGRTGPCAQALVDAGVARVVFAQADPNPLAHGGAETLRGGGVDVEGGLLADEARAVNRAWSFAHQERRPFVTWKLATTLDGRSAAADGTSRWVSSLPARRDTHRLRAACDAVLVGTGTVLADDPRLTVRDDDDVDLPREQQPLRVVMGRRELPPDRRVLDDSRRHPRARDPRPRQGTRRAVRARRPARLPRGRADAGGGVPDRRPRRRGGRLRRADAARIRAERRRRPRHLDDRRRRAASTSPTSRPSAPAPTRTCGSP